MQKIKKIIKTKQDSLLKSGFTLLEILVSVSLLVVLALVSFNIFFSLMKGAAKTKVLSLIKQEGNYALTVMERTIRNATQLEECGADYITLRNQEGEQITFHFCGDPDFLIAAKSGDRDSMACKAARLTSDQAKLVSNSLTCTPPMSEFDSWVVKISFTLSQAAITSRPEEQAAIDFQTTISLRNLP